MDAYSAVYTTEVGWAYHVLDIAKDLAGVEHYAGPLRRDAGRNYYLEIVDSASILVGYSMIFRPYSFSPMLSPHIACSRNSSPIENRGLSVFIAIYRGTLKFSQRQLNK